MKEKNKNIFYDVKSLERTMDIEKRCNKGYLQKKLSKACYFGLHFSDNGVEVLSGPSSNDIGDIAALDTSLEQSERYMQLTYGEA